MLNTLFIEPQGVGSKNAQQNDLMAKMMAAWNPLTRPVYQPQPIGYPQPTSGVRG